MNDFKDKTCEDCRFRVKYECRRFPPSILHKPLSMPEYPLVVSAGTPYSPACSEHTRPGEMVPLELTVKRLLDDSNAREETLKVLRK